MVLYDFHLQLMSCWILFQYFDTSILKGEHVRQIIDISFKIAENNDEYVIACKEEIREWRKSNSSLIERLNASKSSWQKEKSRCKRLVEGLMKSTEVELYHIVAVCNPKLDYELNCRVAACKLGLSEHTFKRVADKKGFNRTIFPTLMTLFYEEDREHYLEEYNWANKVLNNTLTRKERREFWKEHTIYNLITLFRTAKGGQDDLIPAENPLETSDDQDRTPPYIKDQRKTKQMPSPLIGDRFKPIISWQLDFDPPLFT